MGGGAFENTERLSPDEYERVVGDVTDAIFKGTMEDASLSATVDSNRLLVACSPALLDKDSHGDVDVMIGLPVEKVRGHEFINNMATSIFRHLECLELKVATP